MKILVTGGAGFIGSHMVDRLAALGHGVTAFDNLQAGKAENLRGVRSSIRFVKGDLRDPRAVERAVRGNAGVIHIGANASVPLSVEDPRYDFETNAGGTMNVLEACRKRGVKRVLYASTAAAYGEPDRIPMDEGHPLRPVSPYGASKLTGESMGFAYREAYGLDFAAARIFNIYGPRQPRYVMADLYHKLKRNPKRLEVLGDGTQVRDPCYVSDAVEALWLLFRRGEGCTNIASGKPTTVRRIAEGMVARVAPGARIVYTGKSWAGDIKALIADNRKLRRLGWRPKVGLEEGLDRFVEWMDAHSARKR
ncbi:MAG: GDP-mannose 4,6-dehydratase [Halobacteria archaeon]